MIKDCLSKINSLEFPKFLRGVIFSMTNGFCPSCNRIVMTKREDIDAGLACFLFIFTAGIGFFIYLLIYYSQPEDRCMFCGSRVSALPPPNLRDSNYKIDINQRGIPGPPKENNFSNTKAIPEPIFDDIIPSPLGFEDGEEIKINDAMNVGSEPPMKFCPFCGAEIETFQKFCSYCGAELTRT